MGKNRKRHSLNRQNNRERMDSVCRAILSDLSVSDRWQNCSPINFGPYALGKAIGESSEGAFVIVRFARPHGTCSEGCEDVVEYALVEEDKSNGRYANNVAINFPGGSKDEPEEGIYDASVVEAGLRETREEIFYQMQDIHLSASEENRIGKLNVRARTVTVIYTEVPHEYKHRVKKGPQQIRAFTATAHVVDSIMRSGKMRNHVNAWNMYKKFANEHGIEL